MMNENIPTPQTENNDRYKTLIVMLTIVTTVMAAVIAALQSDASIRADTANRESQYLAILASGELDRAGLEANYQFNVFGDYLKNQQEATILELTALEQEISGDVKTAEATRVLASASQARADVGRKFSIFFTDPRYAPKDENAVPNAEQYLVDSHEEANDLLAKQNEAADLYELWNSKSDRYVTALTILSISFFLFGLAQAVRNNRLRLSFAILGVVIEGFSLILSLFTVLM